MIEHATTANATAARKVYRAVKDAKPTAIAIYCSDPRFQPAFHEFIEHDLGLGEGMVVPTVVGGGAGVLGHPEQLPKEFKFLRERLEQYRQIFPTVSRIILINHEDCRYYETLKTRVLALLGSRFNMARHFEREDLSLVSTAFRHFLAHLGYSVELYYAHFADPEHTHIQIDKVAG